ncbi:winged helix-turn-helix domain-containing protein [Halobellus inordinatus]|uniref:winged helix-turn-helix domain-containing protein n=1 Tax=Halobellus inordinatus TaxID=1126236 RepID=UPI002108BC1A|nr:winged helix-turn-helix domain-containing protein [Halobellus inordinatus]
MTDAESTDDRWEGDVNEAAVEDWTADTTTFERVRQIIDVTTEPQSASETAERAHVSEPTARKHLSALAETGRVKTITTKSGTRYMRAPEMLAMRRIADIHREHTKDEIRQAIRDLKEERRDFQDHYDVADVDELTLELEPGDEGWGDLTRWQQVEQNLEIAQAALTLYDFDPDDSRSAAARASDGRTSARDRGALGDDTAQTV